MVPTETVLFRVRYCETDQMGTYNSARALEWFEMGRTELTRRLGLTYADMEARGIRMPVIEAHVAYRGRARYDDLLQMTIRAGLCGPARMRFDVEIVQAEGGAPVAGGYTIHAITDAAGKPIRPPQWFVSAVIGQAAERP